MPRLVVDGVGFQGGDVVAVHVWEGVLAGLGRDLDVVLLDRGNAPCVAGIERLPFPNWSGRETAADSLLLEEICKALGAAFFLSTGGTTPVRTPSIAVIPGLQPGASGYEAGASGRQRLEEEAAILHARRRVCVTADARDRLVRSNPELREDRVSLVEHGVDPQLFRPRDPAEFSPLAQRLGLSRDHVLIVDDAFTDAAPRLELARTPGLGGLDWVFLNGGPRPADADSAAIGGRSGFAPSADELALLLGTAAAVAIAPNLRTLPLWADAALKCRCPVIVHGPSTDAGRWGAAATLVEDGWSAGAILKAVRAAPPRSALPDAATGLPHAPDRLAAEIVRGLSEVGMEVDRGEHADFYEAWANLRQIQARVDF